MTIDYLDRIMTSPVYDIVTESKLEFAPKLSSRLFNRVMIKREDTHAVFSFKIRGAYNKMARLSQSDLNKGVVCASAGNHAQGVAMSAQFLKCQATIVMPTTTPTIKVDAVIARGAKSIIYGDSYDDACEYAQQLAERESRIFVHPYDDPDVIAGQGTIAMEIFRQNPGPIEAIFVPVGGGGLLAGIAACVKTLRPNIKVIGVEPTRSNAMSLSLAAGKRIQLSEVDPFADGVAVKKVGEEPFRLCSQFVDEVVLVSNDQICDAISDMFNETRSILEPAGALAIAGAKAYAKHHNLNGKVLVAIASGANMNFEKLRYIADRTALSGYSAAKEPDEHLVKASAINSVKEFA